MGTTVVAVGNTPEEIQTGGLLGARYHAHELELALHLAYWRTEDQWNIDYHRNEAKLQYERLTADMRKAGIIE